MMYSVDSYSMLINFKLSSLIISSSIYRYTEVSLSLVVYTYFILLLFIITKMFSILKERK